MKNALQNKLVYNKKILPVMLLVPTIIVVLVVMILPLFYGMFISLFDYRIGSKITIDKFVGFSNYFELVKDKVFLKSLYNTIIFSVFANIGDIAIGTLISIVLLKLNTKVANFLRGICTMSLLVSPIITGFIWKYMFDPSMGLVYWLLSFIGINSKIFPGLGSPNTALLCVVFAHWWQITPFVILVVTSGLLSIPEERYEAASIDGAGSIRSFFYISLPALIDVYFVILIISGIDTIKVFDIIYSLTRGGPANSTISLSIYAFRQAFEVYRMGYAMAISMFLMLIAFIIFALPFIRFNLARKD